jgi:hypothetical protein
LTLLDGLPVWWEAAVLFVTLCVACEIAGRVPGHPAGESGKEGYLVSASLGLLSLLLGFTFSLSLSRYEIRRTLVVQEANAIATVARRADFLAPAGRDGVRAVLIRYTGTRLQLATAGEDTAAIARAEAATRAEEHSLWATAVPEVAGPAAVPAAGQMVQPLNDMFGLAATRRAALAARIPTHVVTVLGLYAIIAAAILGYAIGRGRLRHRMATTALFFLLSITVGLILDLDRPRTGVITVSQQPLLDVLADLRQAG